MARLILPRKWTQQPTGPTYIDPGNPLTDGLIDALLPIGGLWQSVPRALGRTKVVTAQDQTPFTNTNGPTQVWSQRGFAYKYDKASSQYSLRTSAPLTQVTEASILVVVYSPGSETSSLSYVTYGSSAADNPILRMAWVAGPNPRFVARDSAGTLQALNGTANNLTAGYPHILIGTRSQVQNFHRAYCDGVLSGSATATTLGSVSLNRTCIGATVGTTIGSYQDGTIALVLTWNRALQPDEVNALSVNPWQVFASPSAGFYYTGAPAAAAEVTGTLSVTLGALTLSGAATVPVSGSLASTLGALTVSATGTVPVAASLSTTLADVTLSGTGTVPVTSALNATLSDLTLSGTGTVADGPSGNLSVTLDALTLSATATVTGLVAQAGPADDRGYRKRRDTAALLEYWRRQQEAKDNEEARKRAEALEEAEEALERAEAAKRADARRKAVREVFEALSRASADKRSKDSLAAEARAIADATAAQVKTALARLDEEVEAVSRALMRRAEEEEFLLRMWARN